LAYRFSGAENHNVHNTNEAQGRRVAPSGTAHIRISGKQHISKKAGMVWPGGQDRFHAGK